jgi:hypothetical protein
LPDPGRAQLSGFDAGHWAHLQSIDFWCQTTERKLCTLAKQTHKICLFYILIFPQVTEKILIHFTFNG